MTTSLALTAALTFPGALAATVYTRLARNTNPAAVLLAALLAAWPCVAAASAQQERIASFDAVVIIEPTGTLHVTEAITAVSAGEAIRRGIYRSLMVPERGWMETNQGPAYSVAAATRGGSGEPWRARQENGAFTVYLGRDDTPLPPGEHAYTLTYEARSQVRLLQDHDELSWNVTGNGWAFPVERASVVVMLPPGADSGRYEAYTGPAANRGRDYAVRQDGPGRLVFETTRPLAPGEGFTVSVAWPKGFVTQPGWRDAALTVARANPSLAASAAGLVLAALYFTAAWLIVRRPPSQAPAGPRTAPPEGLCAVAVRAVRRMGHDPKDLACAVAGLAASGALGVSGHKGGGFALLRSRERPEVEPFEEEAALEALFRDGPVLDVDRANRDTLKAAQKALRASLRRSTRGHLFTANPAWFAPGCALGLVSAALAALSAGDSLSSAGLAAWFVAWAAGAGLVLWRVAGGWCVLTARRRAFLACAGALLACALALPPVIGKGAGPLFAPLAASPFAGSVLLATATLCAAFLHLLKAPTREGWQALEQIEGFRLFLAAPTENGPETAPEGSAARFEQLLPHAMALDLETALGERFAGVIAQAAAASGGYAPGWYQGPGWDAPVPDAFCARFGASLAAALGQPGPVAASASQADADKADAADESQ